MLSCTRAQHLRRFLDDEMDEAERIETERHVETCGLCQGELEQLTAGDTAAWPVPPAPWGDGGMASILPPGPPRDGDLPRVLGYEVRGELGSGGMGVVYRAYDPRLKREVALKMIRADHKVRPSDLARFRTDAEALARLRHPNIAQIYDVSESDGRPYFALELAEGGSLEKQLGDRAQPPDVAARMVETLARAVQYAHQRGVIHRDLKPGNILLTSPGEPPAAGGPGDSTSAVGELVGVPKIADFGLAKFLDAEGVRACLTLPDFPLGTPSYMAWEQAAGKVEEISTLTDVYGLGAILYKLLTGRAPYNGGNNLEIIRKVQSAEERPPRPGQLQPSLPGDLELICLKCLEKEPRGRYASAEQLANELAHFLNKEPLEHTRRRPAGLAERLWMWGRRNRALAAACAAAFVALVVGTIVSTALSFANAKTARELQTALDESEKKGHQLEETNRKATAISLGLGLHLCEQGDVALGVLWLAHSLEMAPPDAKDLQRTIRTNLAAWGDTLRPLRASLSTTSEVLTLACSPDGKLVVTGTEDGTVQLWDAAAGKPVGTPLRHQDRVMAVAFSSDGRKVLTGSWDKTACVWDVTTGQAVTLEHPYEVWAVAFSRDGKTVLTGNGEPFMGRERPHRGEARLWEADTGKLLQVLPHEDRVYSVAFGGDDRVVATGSSDKTARLWDATTGNLLHTLPHQGRVWAVTFSPDYTKILTGGFDKTARVWDVASGKPLLTLPHTGAVWAAAFSPDGTVILTGDNNHTAQLWKADTGAALGPPLPHNGPVLAATFSPDGKTALTGCGDRTAQLWDVATGRPLGPALLNPGEVVAVAFGPDGKSAVTASQDAFAHTGAAQLWDLTPKYLAAPLRPPGKVSVMALGPDGKLALAGGEDGRAWLCDTATGNPVGEPFNLPGEVRAAAFSPDGSSVLIATEGGPARRWGVATRQPFGPEFHGGKTIHALAFSPDGRLVLTGAAGEVRLREASTGDPAGEPLRHDSAVWAGAFGPDGNTALIGCLDGAARPWDLTSGKPLGPTFGQDKAGSVPQRKVLLAVALSPDGRTALTGSKDGYARFWDVATGKPIGPPLLHPGAVLAVAFSADGKGALTATAKEVRQWGVPAPVEGNGKRIVLWSQAATGTELDPGGAVRRLDSQTWQERLRRLEELGGSPRP
jgi:WD40 repeat protein/serine/threonine protein kinase